MFFSQKKQTVCSNFSTISYNETQNVGNWSSELTACLFWSIVYNEDLRNISAVAILALLTFSIVINLHLLLGLNQSEALFDNPRYKLLQNLTVSDLLLTLSVAPTALHCLLYKETLSLSMGCIAQYFMGTLAIISSHLTVAFMALERFFYTCHSIHYQCIMTDMRVYSFIILIWSLAVIGAETSTVLALTGGARFGHIVTGFVCEPKVVQAQLEHPGHFEMFNKIYITALLLICCFMFMFCYSSMYLKVQQLQQPSQQNNACARCTFFFYFVIFLLQLCLSTVKIITLFVGNPNHQLLMIILVLVPPCVNPMAYGNRNKEVRQAPGCLWFLKRLKNNILLKLRNDTENVCGSVLQ